MCLQHPLPRPAAPWPWAWSGHVALLGHLHCEGLHLRGPSLRIKNPASDVLGFQLVQGLLCSQDCSFRNHSPRNSHEDVPPEKGSCWLREAATGYFQHRKHWGHSELLGKHLSLPLQSLFLLPPKLDFPAGCAQENTHPHMCGCTYVCAQKHTLHVYMQTHPTCVHANTPYVCYRLRDADIHRHTHIYPPAPVPSCTCLCTHVYAQEHQPSPHVWVCLESPRQWAHCLVLDAPSSCACQSSRAQCRELGWCVMGLVMLEAPRYKWRCP